MDTRYYVSHFEVNAVANLLAYGTGYTDVVNLTTGEPIWNVPQRADQLAFTADGNYLVATGGQQSTTTIVNIYEAISGRLITQLPNGMTTLHPSEPIIAIAHANGPVEIYDLEDGTLLAEIDTGDQRITDITFNADGTLLGVVTRDDTISYSRAGTLQLWGIP